MPKAKIWPKIKVRFAKTMKFERPEQSINQIFEHRKKYIPEIGAQFEKETKAEVEVSGEKLQVDYRIISIKGVEKEGADPVILLPGFGSGWEGISELGFSLAAEGREVIMPSLPGYGNSDNPSEKYYKTDNFDNEAEVVRQLAENISELKGKKFHLIGHSMASEILATFSEKCPDKTSSLVLLNPAGVREKESGAYLGARFGMDGLKSTAEYAIRMRFSGEKDYEEGLKKYIPKTQSPFAKERLGQRLAEAQKLTKGHLLEKLRVIKKPIIYISGELDSVYPPDTQMQYIIDAVNHEIDIKESVMTGLRHNTTIAPDEITAANIEHYLEKAEDEK